MVSQYVCTVSDARKISTPAQRRPRSSPPPPENNEMAVPQHLAGGTGGRLFTRATYEGGDTSFGGLTSTCSIFILRLA